MVSFVTVILLMYSLLSAWSTSLSDCLLNHTNIKMPPAPSPAVINWLQKQINEQTVNSVGPSGQMMGLTKPATRGVPLGATTSSVAFNRVCAVPVRVCTIRIMVLTYVCTCVHIHAYDIYVCVHVHIIPGYMYYYSGYVSMYNIYTVFLAG